MLIKCFFHHIKICDVHHQNLSYNKDVVGNVQFHWAPLMNPREAVGQRDFDQTEARHHLSKQNSKLDELTRPEFISSISEHSVSQWNTP